MLDHARCSRLKRTVPNGAMAHHFIPIPIIQSFHGICCLTGPAIGGMLSVGL